MINFLNKNKTIIAIIIFASILRLWQLGSIPPSLTQDEAALGYNAYSILKTGRDEYGKFLPVIFKSFGDYKPGLYVYLDVPFVAALGLNEFAVRLPSALAGVLSVYLVYLIIRKLFNSMETARLPAGQGKWKLENLGAFVLAITPWSIYLSRGAWEVNVALTLTLAGIYFFLKSFDKNKYLFFSVSCFALTFITYQGAKLSTAIVVLLLLIVYWKEFLKIERKYRIGSEILGLIIAAPIIISLFTGQTGRLDVFSIFSYPRPRKYTQSFLDEGGEKFGSASYYLFHSEALNFTRGILGRWFNHFSGKFLFFEGDYQNPQHSAPYQGMLLITDFIVLVFGFGAYFKEKLNKPKIFFGLWLILSPLPAVLTRDQVQSVRALNMVIPLIIFLTFGLNLAIGWLDSHVAKWFVILIVFIFYLLSFTYFCDAYFIHVPKHDSSYWNYGYRQVVLNVTKVQNNYKNIIVQQSYSQPYIYFLFFQKYDPVKYQGQAQLTKGVNVNDVGLVEHLDNVQFKSIDWSAIRNQHGSLVVVNGLTPIPGDLEYDSIDKIMYLNGRDLAFNIIKIK